jgi:hypothetical protein
MARQKLKTIIIFVDILLLTLSFFTIIWIKNVSLKSYFPAQLPFYSGLVVIWILLSLINGKLFIRKIIDLTSLFTRVLSCNFIIVSTIALLMFIFRDFYHPRVIVLGTALIATILELISGSLYLAVKRASEQNYEDDQNYIRSEMPDEIELVKESNGNGVQTGKPTTVNSEIIKAIENEVGPEVTREIIKMTCRNVTDHTAVLSTTTIFNISSLPNQKYDYIINLRRVNDILKLDDFLNAVNSKLGLKGYFFCCCETKDQRKSRILKKFPPIVNYIYYTFDFILKRVLPKLKLTYGIYYFITHGRNAVLSRAEVLGRLSRAGFLIKQELFIGNLLCVEACKSSEPLPINENIASPLIALPRIGREGNMIKVYKFRTMHPYSEYIQNYVYSLYELQDGGKFRNDFRITTWGAVCRKIWLDELPMFINLIKGDMKLFGVRPLSKQYFELYDKNVRERRIKYKPGLIPPYYADMPAGLEGIQASEMKYLDSYDKHPLITDFRYFWKSWYNILFRNARSK